MKKENALIIVPSEKLLDAPVFERKLKKGERHIKYIKEIFAGALKGQKLLQQNQMPCAADGKPLRNALHNSINNCL